MRKVFLHTEIFWSDVPDPPCQQCQLLAYPPTPPVSTSVFGLPPYPLSQLMSVFGKPPHPAKVLTSFLNSP